MLFFMVEKFGFLAFNAPTKPEHIIKTHNTTLVGTRLREHTTSRLQLQNWVTFAKATIHDHVGIDSVLISYDSLLFCTFDVPVKLARYQTVAPFLTRFVFELILT